MRLTDEGARAYAARYDRWARAIERCPGGTRLLRGANHGLTLAFYGAYGVLLGWMALGTPLRAVPLAAVPGVAVGCLVANLLSPYGLIDVVCGTAATLLAALWTSRIRHRALAPLPPVLCNGAIIGAMLAWYEVGFGPGFWGIFAMNALTVGLGELVACYGLGLPILIALPKIPYFQGRMSPERLS